MFSNWSEIKKLAWAAYYDTVYVKYGIEPTKEDVECFSRQFDARLALGWYNVYDV